MPIPRSLLISISTQSFVSQLCTVFEIRELKLKKNNNNMEKMKNSENELFKLSCSPILEEPHILTIGTLS